MFNLCNISDAKRWKYTEIFVTRTGRDRFGLTREKYVEFVHCVRTGSARGTRRTYICTCVYVCTRNVAQCCHSIGSARSESRSSSFKFSAPRLKHCHRCLFPLSGEDDGWRMTSNAVTGRWHGYSMIGNGSSMAVNGALITQNRRLVYGCCVTHGKMCSSFQRLFIHWRLISRVYIRERVHTFAWTSLRQSLVPRCNDIIDAFARLMKFPPVPLRFLDERFSPLDSFTRFAVGITVVFQAEFE